MRALITVMLLCWTVLASGAGLDEPLILVARPELADPVFGRSVLIVAPVGDGQHVGFIVNRPSNVTLGKVFPEHGPSQKVVDPIYVGGPIEPGVLFALVQRQASPGGHSAELAPGLYLAYESAVVDQIIESEPQHARFVAGMVVWQPGELQRELDAGAWLVLDPDPTLVMHKPDGLWDELVLRWKQRRYAI